MRTSHEGGERVGGIWTYMKVKCVGCFKRLDVGVRKKMRVCFDSKLFVC